MRRDNDEYEYVRHRRPSPYGMADEVLFPTRGGRHEVPVTRIAGSGQRTRIQVSSSKDPYRDAPNPDGGTVRNRIDCSPDRPVIHFTPTSRRRGDPILTRERHARRRRSRSRSRESGSRPSDDASDPGEPGLARTSYAWVRRARPRRFESDQDDSSIAYVLPDYALDRDKLSDLVALPSEDSDAVQPGSGSWPNTSENSLPDFGSQVSQLFLRHSRWLGNAFDERELKAEVKAPALSNVGPHPTMKWFHLERDLMSYEEFLNVSQQAAGLPENDQRHLRDTLARVQKEHEKQRPHGREMEPVCLADVDYKGEKEDRIQTSSLLFFSVPFFTLETYSASRYNSLPSGLPAHPIRPMMQAHTRTTNEKRDMTQVVTTRASTPKGHCLHISTLWCLIVNEDLMLTCSHLPASELRGNLVNLIEPPQDTESNHIRIAVGIGNTREWRIPARNLETWSALIASLGDRLSQVPSKASFIFRNETTGAKKWSSLAPRLSHSQEALIVKERLGQDPRDLDDGPESVRYAGDVFRLLAQAFGDPAVSSQPSPIDKPAEDTHEAGAVREDVPPERVRAQRINIQGQTPTSGRSLEIFFHACNGSEKRLTRLADCFHEMLMGSPQPKEIKAYVACPTAKARDIFVWYNSAQRTTLPDAFAEHVKALDLFKVQIISVAMYMFRLFWPSDFEHPLMHKFFGALHVIATNDAYYGKEFERGPRHTVDFTLSVFPPFVADVCVMARSLSECLLGNERSLRPMPEQFHKAWLHFMMAVMLMPQVPGRTVESWDDELIEEHVKMAVKHLRDAEPILTARLRGAEIEGFEVCKPKGIAALMLDRVTRDVMDGCPDVAQTYGDYCQQLDATVTEDPTSRSHQAVLRAFLQEVEAVLSTLRSQLEIVNVFDQGIKEQDDGSRIPDLPLLRNSRTETVLGRVRARLEGRIDQFEALQSRAEDLGQWQLGEIDSNKDRQESAIMVFTIVTIIFLPLSFVASVLGMNTLDVRNMNLNQWVYWAAALPLTFVVIVGSLWWAGELEAIGLWLARTSARPKGGYQAIGEDQNSPGGATNRRKPFDIHVYPRREKYPSPPPGRSRRRTTYPVKSSTWAR